MSAPTKPRGPARFIVAALLNGVGLAVMNLLPLWKPSFLLPSYDQVLWAINLALGVQLALNLVLICFHPAFFDYLTQIVSCAVSIVSLAVNLRVFPVDFSSLLGSWSNGLVRVALILGLVGCAIGGITNLALLLKELFSGGARAVAPRRRAHLL